MEVEAAGLLGGILAGMMLVLKLAEKLLFEPRQRSINTNGSRQQIELLKEIRENTRMLVDLAKDSARDQKSLAGQLARIEDKVRE